VYDNSYGFPQMAKIIPESPVPEGGGFYIHHYVMTEEKARHESAMGSLRQDWTSRGLKAGTYCVLSEKRNGWNKQWMSDTWLERFTNYEILEAARGKVLLAGLGIGLLPVALCRKPDVEQVVVLENEPQVIALVEPYIRHPKLVVLLADAYHPPFVGRVFDTIYLDIWKSICTDNWEEMKPLLAQYRRFATKGATVTGWLKDYLQEELGREKASSWW
jgi:hypothetical protein